MIQLERIIHFVSRNVVVFSRTRTANWTTLFAEHRTGWSVSRLQLRNFLPRTSREISATKAASMSRETEEINHGWLYLLCFRNSMLVF